MRFLNLKTAVLTIATALFLTGCKTTFTNYTPERIPQNPSGIYTFSFAANPPTGNLVRGTVEAQVVINADVYNMEPSAENPMVFQYDYRMPAGVVEARYYFVLSYDSNNNGILRRMTKYSIDQEEKFYQSRLVNRYSIQLVSDRGPVGSAIALVGSGFSPQDVILVGNSEADTTVHSSNSIEFYVPGIAAGQTYPVILRSGGGDIPVGNLRVDAATFSVQPSRIVVDSGSAELLIFQVDNPAPSSGYYVEIGTDVPESVIMPEVIIPGGSRSVSVRVEGGEPGSGIIHAEIPGFSPIRIPVEVR